VRHAPVSRDRGIEVMETISASASSSSDDEPRATSSCRRSQAAHRRRSGVRRHDRHRTGRTATSTISRRASGSTRGPTSSTPMPG
jgi:hypothetical protein